jgi:heterotetrameric sarcosine oxidase delta subunit
MLLLPCPYCGARDQSEFAYGGEAHIARPEKPETLSDEEWAEFVFMRTNTKGPLAERWNHASGCRRWFNLIRDTATDKVYVAYDMGAARPAVNAPALATPAGEPEIGSGHDLTKVVREPAKKEVAA